MTPRLRTGQLVAQLIDVSVRRGDKRVLDGISLSINCGRVLALLGQSGAGKSTLPHVLTGDLAPSEGEIDSGGHDLKKGTAHQAPLLFPWLTVRENAGLGQTYAANKDVPPELVDELLESSSAVRGEPDGSVAPPGRPSDARGRSLVSGCLADSPV